MAEITIHDSFVVEIVHQLEERTLRIISHYRDHEVPESYFATDFRDVVAHEFRHVAAPSILLDVEECDVESIVSMHHELFADGLKHGWPFHGMRNVADVIAKLNADGVKAYQVMGSCGLDGFVLATSCSIHAAPSKSELSGFV
ncbi:hypothetical protein [Rubinisphaera sp. JC750]|uniref:hypothetical protein n=1 Tax=Rubinisphaera sp. JC750 TaxID=2898658 RepID=UPI001F1E16C8|nr:hypothetical protein [Rubinisphaera sp. JC750]